MPHLLGVGGVGGGGFEGAIVDEKMLVVVSVKQFTLLLHDMGLLYGYTI
jgi:hypothetical protein